MKSIRIHLGYLVVFLAMLSLGATYAARSYLAETFNDSVTITGTFPNLIFDDTNDTHDFRMNTSAGHLEIDSIDNSARVFRIHEDADTNQLVLDDRGNIAVHGAQTQFGDHSLEIFGNSGSTDRAIMALSTTPTGTSAQFHVSSSLDSFELGVRSGAGSYDEPLEIDLSAPNDALTINSSGNVGIGGVAKGSIQEDLHVGGGGDILLDASGTTGDWRLDPGSGSLWFSDPNGNSGVLKLINGAPTNSVVASSSGVGIGTAAIDAPLHVFRDDGTAALKVEETSGTTAIRQLMNLQNNGGVRFSLENTSNSRQWEFTNDSAGNFNISLVGTGGREMGITPAGQVIIGPGGAPRHIMQPNGNMIIQGSLTEGSSRETKENFQAVDCEEVLAKVVDLDITTWNYKHDEKSIRHMGPIAEDFREAFDLGENEKTIAAMDKDGVALASIQALNKKLEQEVSAKDDEIRQLRDRLERLEEAILQRD